MMDGDVEVLGILHILNPAAEIAAHHIALPGFVFRDFPDHLMDDRWENIGPGGLFLSEIDILFGGIKE